jgi:hypothetical protein
MAAGVWGPSASLRSEIVVVFVRISSLARPGGVHNLAIHSRSVNPLFRRRSAL